MYYPYIDKYDLYDNLPIYLLIFFIVVILSIFIYIKLAFPFWNSQPVYHSYDFWRTFYTTPFIIHKRFSTKAKSRFCKLQEVEIVPFVDATIIQKKQYVNLLQCYYLSSENSIFVFHLENLEAYFTGHMFSSYLSFYIEKYYNKPNQDNVVTETVVAEKPSACISSRSGHIHIQGHTENIYYIDFICVERGKNFAAFSRNMMETHIYKQQFLDKIDGVENPIMAALFRRDIELLSGIVPITRFVTRYYRLANNIVYYFRNKLPPEFVLVEIGSTNMNLFFDFLVEKKSRFSIFGITDMANLEGLILAKILYVFCLTKLGEVYGVYIFRDTRTQYDEIGGLIQLCGGIMNTTSSQLFSDGFMHSVGAIVKQMPVYKVIMVDELSDSCMIRIEDLVPIMDHWTAYYLYNMVVPQSPMPSSRVFILF